MRFGPIFLRGQVLDVILKGRCRELVDRAGITIICLLRVYTTYVYYVSTTNIQGICVVGQNWFRNWFPTFVYMIIELLVTVSNRLLANGD